MVAGFDPRWLLRERNPRRRMVLEAIRREAVDIAAEWRKDLANRTANAINKGRKGS